MKTLKLDIDDETFERARQIAKKRGYSLELVVSVFLRHLTEPEVAEDRVLGSARDYVELETQVVDQIMRERAMRWTGGEREQPREEVPH